MKKFNDNQPIYLQLREEIEEAIVTGLYKADDMLPSIRKIAAEYRLNPLTVSNAFSELISEGFIYKKRGIGMFVSPDAQSLLKNRKSDQFLNKDLPYIIEKGRNLGVDSGKVKNIVDEIYSKTS